jgi:flagellum-specific ATP synthase
MAAIQTSPFERLRNRVRALETVRRRGAVAHVVGLVIESEGPPARIGELCWLEDPRTEGTGGERKVPAEVVGFRGGRLLLMPLGNTTDVGPQSRVVAAGRPLAAPVSPGLLGRVLDGLGRPMDGLGPVAGAERRSVIASPPPPLERRRIGETLPLGVRAIDALVTCGRGQRLGIFSAAGVGKSALLGMIARNTRADVNVVGLIGERGREVRDFLERDLGEEGLARSVVVVATSDRPAVERIKGALVATTLAEYFRDQGLDVMLMMDSITRFAWAQREVGLAVGEPPTRNGYTPSVFAALPKLLERAGCAATGSITGLYTILTEDEDLTDPVAEASRSILDGHVALSRKLASRGHYPAIDLLQSVSRLMPEVVTPEHWEAANTVRQIVADYTDAEDLVSIGAYQGGQNPRTDRALAHIDAVWSFLRQDLDEEAGFGGTVSRLQELSARAQAPLRPGSSEAAQTPIEGNAGP